MPPKMVCCHKLFNRPPQTFGVLPPPPLVIFSKRNPAFTGVEIIERGRGFRGNVTPLQISLSCNIHFYRLQNIPDARQEYKEKYHYTISPCTPFDCQRTGPGVGNGLVRD